MSAMKKGLGRGFESLIPTDLFDDTFDPTASEDHQLSQLRELPLGDIVANTDQPRQHFDEDALKELADSIAQHGVLQPIVVTKKGDNYEIVAGERRFRAAKAAKLKTIPALVRTVTAQHKLELALIENLQRHDLSALETAAAYAKLRAQFSMSNDAIGKVVGGKSASAVSNTLRLLRLPKEVQKALVDRQLTEGQARPLIDIDEEVVLELLPQIIKGAWSARKVEQIVRSLKSPATQKDAGQRAKRYERDAGQLQKHFATSVRVVTRRNKPSGHILIEYKDEADFARIKKMLL